MDDVPEVHRRPPLIERESTKHGELTDVLQRRARPPEYASVVGEEKVGDVVETV